MLVPVVNMAGDDPFAFLASTTTTTPESKPTGKRSLWKEKFFNRDKNRSSTDQQVEAFLGPTRTASQSQGSSATPRSTASKWPSPQEVINASAGSDSANYTMMPPKKKNPARQGLKVSFTTATPELIGEGGDESDVPTIEVSIQRKRARSQSQSVPQPGDVPAPPEPVPHKEGTPQLRVDTSTVGPNPPDVTRIIPDTKPPLLQNPQDADFLMTLSLGERGSRLSFRASPESNTFAQRVRQKMQLEEGRALQTRFEDDPPSPAEEDVLPASGQRPGSPASVGSLYETPPFSAIDPTPPANNAFQGPPSEGSDSVPPEPPAHKEPTLPFGIKPANTGILHRTPTKAVKTQPKMDDDSPSETSSRPTTRDTQEGRPTTRDTYEGRPSTRDSNASPYQPQAPRISMRAVANQASDAAFVEFQQYVARYSSLFRMSAESVKPLMETSLAEWMRAAVWWFLQGRKALEAYARSCRPTSPGGGSTIDARQAVLDLGKSLWINETIFTQHEELTRYGASSVDALQDIVMSTGDKQIADVLGLHQGILNHLRSLSMSIKKNNILGKIVASEAFEPADNLESSVWLRYPFFAPDVSAVLSGAASRSMLVDRSGDGPSMFTMMPLGDTPRHFSYGTMFVDVYVSSAEDDTQQFAIPCALSILRERTDWYVFAAINSQSDLVNVMIQSDRKKGPTWDDVEWQVRSSSMRVRLPRGFELDVMFQEADFKMIWNIVKYTMKTEDSLKPEAGERVIFESTLKVFQYMDPGMPKAFPAEPIERCRLRLFERSTTVTEGTGTRSVHQGFRITVLTSPKVKVLSNARHILGYGSPVVFGLLRGEDGAPAFVLKVTEEGRTRSMLMTFHDVQERTMMHSLLLGVLAKQNEHKTSDVPIRAFSIEQPYDRVSGRAAIIHLQFSAGTVIVIDQQPGMVEHQYGPTILSEHLRALITSEWGSVTDRINLGPGELKLGLDVNNRTGLSLYRPAQQDLTLSVAENLVRPEMPGSLSDFLQAAMVKPMIRRFDFASLSGMLPSSFLLFSFPFLKIYTC